MHARLPPAAPNRRRVSATRSQHLLLPPFLRPPACSYYLDPKQSGAAAGEDEDEEAAAAAPAPHRPRDAQELLREAEEAAGDAGMEMLDGRGLKRLTLALERKVRGCS